MATILNEPSFEADKLSYEIFSILESKFLFGYDDPTLWLKNLAGITPENEKYGGETEKIGINQRGKVCILSIDGGGMNGIFAGKALEYLEQALKKKSGDPDAKIADYFDVGAGSGVGGIFTVMLFAKGENDRPLYKAEDTWKFLVEKGKKVLGLSGGIFRRLFRSAATADRIFRCVFKDLTLRDTLKPVLIPCYDLSTEASFLFSRADALETESYDFKLRQVCRGTSANPAVFRPVSMKSADGKTRCLAVDGGIVMNNPAAAAITHVLNNKQEFPFSDGVEDLLVLSLGNGDSVSFSKGRRNQTPSRDRLFEIAGDGISDMVDQAVSMAFGPNKASNYVRVQASGLNTERFSINDDPSPGNLNRLVRVAEEMLTQKHVESVPFRGKKIAGETNADKLDWFAGELIKEHQRRKTRIFPTVMFKQATPRTSSVTTAFL